MRIALVIERFEPAGGGMEAVAWQVAHGLVEAGEEVHVVAREAAQSTAVTLQRVRVPIAWQPLRLAAFSREAARVAPRGAFDVVHAFSRTRFQDLYRAGGGSHADYLERVHKPWARALRRLSPRHALLRKMERDVFGDASQAIQCGSELVRDQIARRFGVESERLHVLYNGVDCARFRPAESRDSQTGAVWIFAGSGWRRKGLDTALKALSLSRDTTSVLRVVGRDRIEPWRREADRVGLGDRVEFLGPHRDVAELYRQADGLLLPTRYDAFANVCLEAAASGIPVITSGTNGSAEVLRDAGIVVDDPEDVSRFAASLGELSDPALRKRLGARGREVAEAMTWQRHVEQLRALYHELCR
jgi:UDP-glucose:(heptosyl)LPS alpha-1,3-glucosyltransferase